MNTDAESSWVLHAMQSVLWFLVSHCYPCYLQADKQQAGMDRPMGSRKRGKDETQREGRTSTTRSQSTVSRSGMERLMVGHTQKQPCALDE